MMKSRTNGRLTPPTGSGFWGRMLCVGLAAASAGWAVAGSISVIPEAAFSGEAGMRIVLDDGRPTYVQDDTPEAQAAYSARFYVNFDGLSLPGNSDMELFTGFSAMDEPVFRVTVDETAGALSLSAAIRFNNGGFGSPNTAGLPAVTSGWHTVELMWNAGAGTGGITLSVDGVSAVFDTVTNDMTQLDRVRLGAVTGAPEGTSGSFDVDGFVSRATADPIGNAPVVTFPVEIQLNLGATSFDVSLFGLFEDAETADENLTFEVINVSDPAIVTNTELDAATGMLTLTIGTAGPGAAGITVRATDESDLSAESTISLVVNGPPVSAGIDDIFVLQDAPNSAVALFDVFSDDLQSVESLVLGVEGATNGGLFAALFIDDTTGVLTLNYAPTASGTSMVTVSATDFGGLKTTETFMVTVDGVPTTSGIDNVFVNVGETLFTLDLDTAFDDPEVGAAGLSYTFTNSNTAVVTSIAHDAANNQLLFVLAAGGTGQSDIEVRAEDPQGQFVVAPFTLFINGAPTTTGIDDVMVNANGANTVINLLTFFADAEDGPGGLTYTVVNNTAPGLFDVAAVDGGTLTLDYATNASGMATITVRATDTNGLFVESAFTVLINGGPMSTGIGGVTVNVNSENSVVDLFAAFSDAEDADEDLVYTVAANSNAALFDAVTIDGVAGTLTLDYAADVTGSANITVRATDMGGLFTEAIFTVVVNGPPAAAGLANVAVNINAEPTTVNLRDGFDDAEDADADLTYAVTANTNEALFESVAVDNTTDMLTLTYAAGATGTAMLTVQATDTGGLMATTTFTVTVNGAPTTTGVDDVSVSRNAENTTVDLTASFADAEDGAAGLTYTITANTNEALFAAATIAGGTLTLDYAEDTTGEAEITIRATDSGGLFVETTFTVTVSGGLFSCAAGGGTAPGGQGGDAMLLLAVVAALVAMRRYGLSGVRE